MQSSFCSFWHGQLGLIPPGARHLAAACLEGKPLQLPSVQAVVECSFWPQGIRAAADVLSSLQPSQTNYRLPSHQQRVSITQVLASAAGGLHQVGLQCILCLCKQLAASHHDGSGRSAWQGDNNITQSL